MCGVIHAQINGESVTINLTDPQGLALNERIPTSGGEQTVHSLNTGVPHAVLFVDEADAAMVSSLGEEIRFHDHFAPAGTNVNFAQILAPGHIRVRTYERGVGETLACGTGVSASGMIAAHLNDWPSPVKVDVLGGDTMGVAFDRGRRAMLFRRCISPARRILSSPVPSKFESAWTPPPDLLTSRTDV